MTCLIDYVRSIFSLQHYLRVHADRKFICPTCSRKYITQSELNGHMINCGESSITSIMLHPSLLCDTSNRQYLASCPLPTICVLCTYYMCTMYVLYVYYVPTICVLCMYYMCTVILCVLCMYHMCTVILCVLCMYHMCTICL